MTTPTVPYTVILQSDSTGSVSSMLLEASPNAQAARLMATKAAPIGSHVVALVRGQHPVLPGIPVNV
jgi:hypothetical protein